MSTYGKAVRSTAIYGFGVLLSRAASVLLLPLYTHYLTPRDYGVLELLDVTGYTVAVLLGVRIAESLFYFYEHASTARERGRVASTCLLGGLGIGAVTALTGNIAAPLVSRLLFGTASFAPAVRLSLATVALNIPLEIALYYVRVIDRPRVYVGLSLARLIVGIGLNIALIVGLHMGLYGILNSGLVAAACVASVGAFYVFRRCGIGFAPGLLWKQLRYSAPLALGGVGFLIINFGDRYFLKYYISLREIGLYALAYKIGMLVSYAQLPLDAYWQAQMFALVKGPGGDRRYVRVCTYEFMVVTYVALALVCFMGPLLHIMAPPSFSAAAPLAKGLVLVYLIRSTGAYFRSVFALNNVTRKDARVTWIGTVVCVLGYAALIPRFAAWGAVWATGAAVSVMFGVGLWEAQRVRRFEFEYGRLAAVVGLAGGLVVIYHVAAPPSSLLGQMAVGAACACSYPALLYFLRVVPNEERQLVRALLRRGGTHWRAASFKCFSQRGYSDRQGLGAKR